jgi:hypothetical protein
MGGESYEEEKGDLARFLPNTRYMTKIEKGNEATTKIWVGCMIDDLT